MWRWRQRPRRQTRQLLAWPCIIHHVPHSRGLKGTLPLLNAGPDAPSPNAPCQSSHTPQATLPEINHNNTNWSSTPTCNATQYRAAHRTCDTQTLETSSRCGRYGRYGRWANTGVMFGVSHRHASLACVIGMRHWHAPSACVMACIIGMRHGMHHWHASLA